MAKIGYYTGYRLCIWINIISILIVLSKIKKNNWLMYKIRTHSKIHLHKI